MLVYITKISNTSYFCTTILFSLLKTESEPQSLRDYLTVHIFDLFLKMAVSFVQRRFASSAIRRLAYNLSGFNKLGLMRDDCLYEDDDVQEALRRLPEEVRNDRNYRILRAVQLNIQHSILPKEQWTKYEDDVTYLQPYLKEVIKEREEREAWDKNY